VPASFVFELDLVYTIKEHVQMFNIMSLRHHWTKNFSIPALFMPRLLAITAFPGFVYVFNNSYFWLWYSRLWIKLIAMYD
jgi:hypothetical protein